jgi:hypothetical protein
MIEYDGKTIKYDTRSVPLRIGSHAIETIKLALK